MLMKRKDLKRNARRVVKKKYISMIILCFLLAFFGIEYGSTIEETSSGFKQIYLFTHPDELAKQEEKQLIAEGKTEEEAVAQVTEFGYNAGILDVFEKAAEASDNYEFKSKVLGHSRGVFASLINGFTKGTFVVQLTDGFTAMFQSEAISVIFMLLLSILFTIFMQYFVKKIILILVHRMVLEHRVYEKCPGNRFLFLFAVKRWFRVGLVMFYETILMALWGLTIIGAIIKSYSYAMVPYIIAENPDFKAKEAVTLSRKMMNGHKWELFKLDFSFIGWGILSMITSGLSSLFYSNAYKEVTQAEYYAYIRKLAKENEIPGSEKLNDVYLFEKADPALLREIYADAATAYDTPWIESDYLKGIKGVIAKVFGIVLFIDKDVKAVEDIRETKTRMLRKKECLDGVSYPVRLSPIPASQRRRWVAGLNYSRYYTIWNLLTMFIIFCFIGWCWEVSLHIIQDGTFVNRGMLHGPWIPIYGSGGILILIALKLLRKHPIQEFFAAIVLSGILEYTTSWLVEMSKGKRWWDYSGYFLNLDGRICGEGLLVFGIMGMVVVYLAAPVVDHYLRLIPKNVIVPLSIALMALFTVDSIYSSVHPNEGKGITDYKPVTEEEEEACIDNIYGFEDLEQVEVSVGQNL